MPGPLDGEQIERALGLLAGLLDLDETFRPHCLVVCGGAALSVLGLQTRTTKDVDIVALRDPVSGDFVSPAPLPAPLVAAAALVAREQSLPPDWLNNGPSSGEGGLFQLGLPVGMAERLTTRQYGEKLAVAYVSRFDQIHFKLYAAIDQPGSYHTADLRHLLPTSAEIESAVRWAMTQDVSEGFRAVAADFIRNLGYPDVAARI